MPPRGIRSWLTDIQSRPFQRSVRCPLLPTEHADWRRLCASSGSDEKLASPGSSRWRAGSESQGASDSL